MKEPKRVAILVPNFAPYSGDARVVYEQAKEKTKNYEKVSIITLNSEMNPPDNVQLIVLGMPSTLFLQRVYRLFFPLDILKVAKALKILKEFDTIIVHLYPLTVLGSLAKKKYNKEYIFWYHGLEDPEVFPRLYQRIYIILQRFFTKLTISNADMIVAVSHFAKEHLKRRFGFDSRVIHNTIDKQLFNKKVSGHEIRIKYNLGDSPVILSVGRVVPQKGFHLLIKAYKLIKKEIPDVKLMIVGPLTFPDYEKELRTLADEDVIFTGAVPREEIPKYYAACDIYATCSLWENHNLPILEAQACGKPVVAFNFPPFREEIRNGILVDPFDIEKFAHACINLIRRIKHEHSNS